jgi:hypothetical protein
MRTTIKSTLAVHLGTSSMACAFALYIAAPLGAQTVYFVADLSILLGETNSQSLASASVT